MVIEVCCLVFKVHLRAGYGVNAGYASRVYDHKTLLFFCLHFCFSVETWRIFILLLCFSVFIFFVETCQIFIFLLLWQVNNDKP